MIDYKTSEKIVQKEKDLKDLQNKYEIEHALCGIAEIIQYLESGNYDFGLNGFFTYRNGGIEFDSLFSQKEVLKLDHKNSPQFDRDYIFYLDTNELLKITVHEDWMRPNASHEKNYYITVDKTSIDTCVAHNYKKASQDLLFFEGNYIIQKLFTLIDCEKYRIKTTDDHFFAKEYKRNDFLESVEGKDIREILVPLNINDIIDRIINRDGQLVIEDNPKRNRQKGVKNDK